MSFIERYENCNSQKELELLVMDDLGLKRPPIHIFVGEESVKILRWDYKGHYSITEYTESGYSWRATKIKSREVAARLMHE